jgi:hypothetical protein
MSSAAIKAGKAWVELSIQDKTARALAAVQNNFRAWGAGLSKVGGVLTAAAGSVLAPLPEWP